MTRTMKTLAWTLLVLLPAQAALARPAATPAPEAPAESRTDGRPPPPADRRIDLDFKNADIRDSKHERIAIWTPTCSAARITRVFSDA